ncbi:MAG: hypothetical protein RIC35_24210 [Marinoscillum sp.]
MRTNLVFIGGILCCLSIVWLMKSFGHNPEADVLGKWTEVSWAYEKMDHTDETASSWLEELDEHVKAEISKPLIIHEAEEWYFLPDHQLALLGKQDGELHLTWKLKGRGNILELRHDNLTVEQYTIQEITDEQMTLHFNTELQAKGIVKMIFRKSKTEYAQK